MSHDQKPARIRVVTSGTVDKAGGALSGGFATGPAPRRPAQPRAPRVPGLTRATISILFLSAALVGGVVQAWFLLRA